MRRITFFTLIFLSLLSGTMVSQEFKMGIIIGACGSQVDGDQYSGYNKLNGVGGLFIQRSFSESTNGRIELKYIGKGAVERSSPEGVLIYKVSMHYLEIPVLVAVNIHPKYQLYGGMSAGVLFASYEGENRDGYLIEITDGEQFNPLDVNIQAGISYQISDPLFLDARFGYSIIPVKSGVASNPHYRGGGFNNNMIEIAIGYYFK